MSVVRTMRFLVGAALVVAGVPLVTPFARNLVVAARATGDARDAAGRSSAPPPNPVVVPTEPAATVPPGSAAAPGDESPAASWSMVDGSVEPDSSGGLQLDRSPPPPPAPLPPLPEAMLAASPSFAAAYRSTLRVPPPDLLDAAGPPPAVSWTAPQGVAVAVGPAVRSGSPEAPLAEITVPATYRVRDGDDLGSIAGRLYGHPGAASAIWAANRDLISNPDLLPIGAELRLPPPWSVGASHRGSGAIEPAAYARPTVAPQPNPVAPGAPRGGAWLPPAGDPTPASGVHVPALIPAPATAPPPGPAPNTVISPVPNPAPAASVRVGAGETLPSLARRLYGDPAMAGSIFAVNRDRLRSPELVVAGMELRLPRPVTAPRP